jgi:hypothetical protein
LCRLDAAAERIVVVHAIGWGLDGAVVIFIVIITFVTVRRSEVAMREDLKEHGGKAHH